MYCIILFCSILNRILQLRAFIIRMGSYRFFFFRNYKNIVLRIQFLASIFKTFIIEYMQFAYERDFFGDSVIQTPESRAEISKHVQKKKNSNLTCSQQTIDSKQCQGQSATLLRVLKKHKIQKLTKNFINKLRHKNINRKPPIQSNDQQSDNYNVFQNISNKLQLTRGLQLGNLALTIWSIINIVHLTITVFVFSIMISFQETQQMELFIKYRILTISLVFLDILMNFCTQRYQCGKKFVNCSQIANFYINNGFYVDLISLLIFVVNFIQNNSITSVMSLVSIIKLLESIKKFQKFEYLYVKTTQKQQYYGLIKIFLTNFMIGHFLSILLNLMATINPSNNWHIIKNISLDDWYIKYAWGYYWGTNIMLSVGFGDLVATTYTQAIVLIFIETFSCITLGYNISMVGSLLGQLKLKDEKKKKQLKTFHRMSHQNQISTQLTTRISNFIQQSFQIRETFEFQQQDNVISSLPKRIQAQFLVQSNKLLFDNIGFLINMSKRTLVNLAQTIQRKISHPGQIINKKGNLIDFTIVQNGSIGLCYRKQYSKLNGETIQKIQVNKGQRSKLISLDFIKGKTYINDIKSLGYSIIYFLQRDKFIDCLKDFQLDYQFFCTVRDRDQYLFGENQLYSCSICKNQFHNKFTCNRLHFVPIKQHVISKYNLSQYKAERISINRMYKIGRKKTLKQIKILKMQLLKFLKVNYGKSYIQKSQKQMITYQKELKYHLMQKKKPILQIQPKNEQIYLSTLGSLIQELQKKNEFEINCGKIQKFLNTQTQFGQFWNIQTDQIKNYKYYFARYNADNLVNLYSPKDYNAEKRFKIA